MFLLGSVCGNLTLSSQKWSDMKALIELENSQKLIEEYLPGMPDGFYNENLPVSWKTKLLFGDEQILVPTRLYNLVDAAHGVASEELIAILGNGQRVVDPKVLFPYVGIFDTFIPSEQFNEYPMLRAFAEFLKSMRALEKTMNAVTEEPALSNCYLALKQIVPYQSMPELSTMLSHGSNQYSKSIGSLEGYLLRSFQFIYCIFNHAEVESINKGLTRYAEVSNQSHEEVEQEANALFEPILTLLETTKQVLSTR